ncbi:hypothetical protein ACFV3R_10025 [Streptomyces sp. NPDC059740]|uniref:hypothetical protein n=1 Tax=Streptomyces sp. NPDC059740 TaxID=3346926 RepID=UPI0036594DD8
MTPSPVDALLAEEQLAAALHNGIAEIRRCHGSCTADQVAAHLVQQLTAGLLRQAVAPDAVTEALDVERLIQRDYGLMTKVANRDAHVRFTAGLGDSCLDHEEHLDLRAEVSLRYRVDLRFKCGLSSRDGGATWTLAFTEAADKGWLESVKAMKEPVGDLVTALAHDSEHRDGLEPVVEAARHVAAMRALSRLRVARTQLATAGTRALAARAVFDQYGYAVADLERLRTRLAELAWSRNRGLIGW